MIQMMTKTTIVNVNNDFYNVYIGRDSKWGNPFKIGNDIGRNKSIELYTKWLLENKSLMNDIHEIEGKVLGCHCKPKNCHGDILCDIINRWNFQL